MPGKDFPIKTLTVDGYTLDYQDLTYAEFRSFQSDDDGLQFVIDHCFVPNGESPAPADLPLPTIRRAAIAILQGGLDPN